MLQGDLYLVRGDDQDVCVAVNTPDGTPYNLSGCALIFTARDNLYFSPIVLTKVITSHIDPTNGISNFPFTTGDTASLNDTSFYYDIKLLSSSSRTITLAAGNFRVFPN